MRPFFLCDPKRDNCLFRARESNSGAMFGQQTKPRAGAQKNFCGDKNLFAGDSQ